MVEFKYCLAGVTVGILQKEETPLAMFQGFEAPEEDQPEVMIEIWQEQRNFHQWYGVDCYQKPDNAAHLFISRAYPKIRLTADLSWKRFVIEGAACGIDGVMETFLCAFYSYITYKRRALVHASCISWEGESIIFTAPSGTGKTTQAELWQQYMEAEILNGDKVILECADEQCYAWGSPWKGSSPYGKNKRAPLKAIIVLSQGEKNEIQRLYGQEVLAWFFPHVFYPSWDQTCADHVMRAMDCLIRQVPVYHLSCLPDKGAVELVRDVVWGED